MRGFIYIDTNKSSVLFPYYSRILEVVVKCVGLTRSGTKFPPPSTLQLARLGMSSLTGNGA